MSTIKKININAAFSTITDLWTPVIAAQVNTTQVKLARLDGAFVWHHHEHEDELFLVLSGQLRMKFRDGDVVLLPGEMICVPAGVEHCPVAEGECRVLLVEPEGTVNTGGVEEDRTLHDLRRLGSD